MPGAGHSVGTQGTPETGAVSSGACEKRGISPSEMGLSLRRRRGKRDLGHFGDYIVSLKVPMITGWITGEKLSI